MCSQEQTRNKRMNHFSNLPMDIREVILNKKHSLEMEELKTAHTLAINEWEKEVRDLKEGADKELDECQDKIEELEGEIERIHDIYGGMDFRTGAFFAMVGWCSGYPADLDCNQFNYRFDHCVKIFASGITRVGKGDFEQFKTSDSTMSIVRMLCQIHDWEKWQLLFEIELELKQTRSEAHRE